MSFAIQFREALLADAAVQSLIGQRLYQQQMPQRAEPFPLAFYEVISTNRLYAHGLGGSQGTFGWCRVQVTCVGAGADGGLDAGNVAAAIIAATQTFNLSAVPQSPAVLTQAPNFVINQRMGILEQTRQPLFTQVLDLKVYFTDES